MRQWLLRGVLITLAAFLLFGVEAKSQRLVDMTFNSFVGTYNAVTGGTLYCTSGDDNIYSQTLPFQFKFDDYMFSSVYVSCNSFLTFSPYSGSYSDYYSTIITVDRPSIQCMRRDCYVRSGLRYVVEGVAPNRCAVFQWEGNDFYYSYSANMNFQIRLYETSNIVQVCYGSMNRGSFSLSTGNTAGCAFVGRNGVDYINLEAGSPFKAHFSNVNPAPFNNNNSIQSNTDFGYFVNGLTLQLSAYPTLVSTYPADGTILQRGIVYTGSQHPSVNINRINGQQDAYVRFKIAGPLPASNPDYKVIYTATKPADPTDELHYLNPQPVGQPGNAKISSAKGLAARQAPNDGALDLLTNQSQIPGGQYTIDASMVLPSAGNYTQSLPTQTFVIALENDLAINSIVSPKEMLMKKYPLTTLIPIQARVTNIGISDITSYDIFAFIYDSNGVLIYQDSIRWNASGAGLTTGQSRQENFLNFRPRNVGKYRLVITSNLLSSRDDETRNNRYPRQGSEFWFSVNHEIEAEPIAILQPQGQLYVGRPVVPRAKFQNNGVSDISDIPAHMEITDPNGVPVYTNDIIVQDIPSGRINTSDAMFGMNFVPQIPGTYKVCVTINSEDDPIKTNNTYCSTFEVIHALAGTYTIGTTKAGDPRNFNTIQDAVDAMFMKGLTGAVTFELTDASYDVGLLDDFTKPALDFRSKIIGASAINTITFKPSLLMSIQRGGVSINLHSNSGVGMMFGQSASPSNSWAAVSNAIHGKLREYANSVGFITFDGGSQKAIKLRLESNSNFRAAVYLSQGASNITIKNVLIENYNIDKASFNCSLPLTVFEPGQSKFTFEKDIRDNGSTYSTGILLRSIAPTDKGSDNTNMFNLDTLSNMNNSLDGNEISGFGYGIVSLGVGPLYHQGLSIYKHFYNANNSINGNIISNVSRAGIVVGFEEKSSITNNRIFNVRGDCGKDAAGIIVGGEAANGYYGYNNMALNVSGNEISGISSASVTYGIKVEQSRNSYPHPTLTFVHFPDSPESMKITNNVVWGLQSSSAAASRFGIALQTERKAGLSGDNKILTPNVKEYNTRNDMIVNNTVIMSGDGGALNTGMVAGIAIQQATGTKFYNNALAFLDNEADPKSSVFANVFYQGVNPKNGGLVADRNAFWIPSASQAAVYRFIETDATNTVIDASSRDDYKTLAEWQAWTSQDRYSVFGDFTGDLAYTGYDPNRKLRINGTPMGSLLNDRGDRIDWLTSDLSGHIRGAAGQRYDIGAFEFEGGMRVNDLEVSAITAPFVYRASSGTYSDAEYVMTKAPVEVKALIRNDGSAQASGIKATVNIYQETPAGTFATSPVVTETIKVAASSAETIEAAFNLADGKLNEFIPKTYADLKDKNYPVADQFKTMMANITPRYRIDVEVESDQYNANNITSKVVRFYLERSALSMVISAENTYKDIKTGTPTKDEIAGRLNFDSLSYGLNKIGWFTNIDSSRYDFDIFDRLGWEPKTVNYTMYRTMVWTDGSDKPLARLQRTDIRNFLASGANDSKKNLLIGSQEMVRVNESIDPAFVHDVLSASNVAPGNPLGTDVSNDGNTMIGLNVGRGLAEKIAATRFNGDDAPYSGLVAVYANGSGLTLPAYYYKNHSASKKDSLAGVTASSLTSNVVYVSTDWRHFGTITTLIREMFDNIEKNGGIIIPVELTDFNATARDRRIDLTWTTASEMNSDRFEVERAEKVNGSTSMFETIATEKAAGKSNFPTQYGPVVDRNVEMNHTYVYRLRMFDKNGNYKLSGEAVASLTGGDVLWLTEATPNPAESMTTVGYSVPQSGQIEIALYDMAGRKVMTVESGVVEAGTHEVKLNVSSLTNGVYTLMLTSGNDRVTRQVSVVK